MDFIHSFILAAIEGVAEFLPISSTGHLIIVSKLLAIPQTDFVKSFEIAIQSGAILAVVILYWKQILSDRKIFKNIAYAFVPTAVVGFVLYKFIKGFLIGNLQITLLMLVLGGVAIIFLEKYFKKSEQKLSIQDLTIKQSAFIGLVQSIAVVPGVSRAAATILGGMGIGLRREEATRFSFMLAIPTMFAATGYDLLKSASSFNSSQIQVLAFGFLVSFVFAFLAVRWFIAYVRSRTLIPFGIYRIVAGIVLYLILQH
ncbi:MAG TPA: undecaprenyl-diphosphatase UppP [Patescibacteria group bacterium]|nr:undecaprenyl-diphosphatase UppP [Patescibacteria group bacterium]